MTAVELHHGAASDVGLVREINEDAFLVAPPVSVVADGMAAAVAAGGCDNATAVFVDVVGLVADRPDDSDAQRMSLEQKLGATP